MKTYLFNLFLGITLLSGIMFSGPATAALADGVITPQAIPQDGWGLDFNWSYIRANGMIDIYLIVRNLSGESLNNLIVRIEANDVEKVVGPFNLPPHGGNKFIRQEFRADPLPAPGIDIFVSATLCVDSNCAAPVIRRLNDEREDNQGGPLSTRVRYETCAVRLMVEEDPDFSLDTNGRVIASGHLGAGQWSQWFDLSPYAAYPASPLNLTLRATWSEQAPVTEHFTVPATYMNCLPPPPVACKGITLDKTIIAPEGEEVKVNIKADNADQYRLIRLDNGQELVAGNTHILSFRALPNVQYQVQVRLGDGAWSDQGCLFSFETPTRCTGVEVTPPSGAEISAAGAAVEVTTHAVNASYYRIVRRDNQEIVTTGSSPHLLMYAFPQVPYQAEVSSDGSKWSSSESCQITYSSKDLLCKLTTTEKDQNHPLVFLGAIAATGEKVSLTHFKANSNFSLDYSATMAERLPVTWQWPGTPSGSWFVQFEVSADNGQTWVGGEQCRLEYEHSRTTTGQYQDFVGAVPFGLSTPVLEAGKEYFDMTRSIMYNLEYINGNQADIVYRFNGQEVDGVTSSLFHSGGFKQLEAQAGRAVTVLDQGVTKLIAYRYGVEQARIFQTLSPEGARWIHPLDQPFEHKYPFVLELHGPAGVTDLLVYGHKAQPVQYDQNGIAVVELTYSQPGLVAIYPLADMMAQEVAWTTVGSVTYPITTSQTMTYNFEEIGLYHYRLLDQAGQIVSSSQAESSLEFTADPGMTYQAQLAYPATSLFVGLYDDMKFEHPDYWTMPVDGRSEHAFEFHLDYHRLNDPDLGNDHIRGDMVVDGLTLSYGTTSVAQQFPYGRHDGARPGVNIVGIPDVSMVAFCQRPGYHEVVYWGGWENESYYLPDRGWIFDQELADEWNEDQRGDCIDAARRVNMELARQGLRTDHTYRHHGERSQGYQMVRQQVWSAYNLVGMRPPHVGQIFKPGAVLAYYENVEDLLFWGWDLDKGGLADGIGTYELQKYVASLGPAQYVDMTGIHPAEAVFVPQLPALEPAPAQPITEPATVEPTIPELPTVEPTTPETPTPTFPMPEPPAPTPTTPESPTPTPAPPS